MITPVFTTSIPYVTQAPTPSQRSLVTESPLNGEYSRVTQPSVINSATHFYVISSPTSVRPFLTHFLHTTSSSSTVLDNFNVKDIKHQPSSVNRERSSHKVDVNDDDDQDDDNVDDSNSDESNEQPRQWTLKPVVPYRKTTLVNTPSLSFHSTVSPLNRKPWNENVPHLFSNYRTQGTPLLPVIKHVTKHYRLPQSPTPSPYTRNLYPKISSNSTLIVNAPQLLPRFNETTKLYRSAAAKYGKKRPTAAGENRRKSDGKIVSSYGKSGKKIHSETVVAPSMSVTPPANRWRSRYMPSLSSTPTPIRRPNLPKPHVSSSHGSLNPVDYPYRVTSNPVVYDPTYFEDLWFDLITTPAVFYKADSSVRTTLISDLERSFVTVGPTRRILLTTTTAKPRAEAGAGARSGAAAATRSPPSLPQTPPTALTTKQQFLKFTGGLRRYQTTKAPVTLRRHTVTKTAKTYGKCLSRSC
ncbi:unnamed protein product [Enterobius vermicularis]|uniref:Uncharacterized protein n=1 Tax=Enterobius vermicularis TaxID=51028 RepID=A0A3P6IFH5_ENTVE|nr:unnamed protein product [Enterobius vermicularis]